MNNFLKVTGIVALILALLWLLVPRPSLQDQMTEMPWQIKLFDDGASKALGVHLGHSSLKDVMDIYGTPEGLSLFTAKPDGEGMSLEAYFGTVRNGPLAAKLIVVLEAEEEEMRAMAGRALTRKAGASGAYQWLLIDQDKAASQPRIVKALTYIPLYSKLDDDFFRSRFGEPASWSRIDEQSIRWFYPTQGVSILIHAEGKEVLDYVMPRDFRMPVKVESSQ